MRRFFELSLGVATERHASIRVDHCTEDSNGERRVVRTERVLLNKSDTVTLESEPQAELEKAFLLISSPPEGPLMGPTKYMIAFSEEEADAWKAEEHIGYFTREYFELTVYRSTIDPLGSDE